MTFPGTIVWLATFYLFGGTFSTKESVINSHNPDSLIDEFDFPPRQKLIQPSQHTTQDNALTLLRIFSLEELLQDPFCKVARLFNFLDEIFLLASTDRGISMYLLLSDSVHDEPLLHLPPLSMMKQPDYLEIFENGGLWILQGAIDGNLLLSKVDLLEKGAIAVTPKNFKAKLFGLHLIKEDERVLLLAVHEDEFDNNYHRIKILSGTDLREISTSKALSKIVDVKIENISEETFIFIHQLECVLLYKLERVEGSLQFIRKLSEVTTVWPFRDALTESWQLALFAKDGAFKMSNLSDFDQPWEKLKEFQLARFFYESNSRTSPLLFVAIDQKGIQIRRGENSLPLLATIPLACSFNSAQISSTAENVILYVVCNAMSPKLIFLSTVTEELSEIEEHLQEFERYLKKQKFEMYKMEQILDNDSLMMADNQVEQIWDGQLSFGRVEVGGRLRGKRFAKEMSSASYEDYFSILNALQKNTLQLERSASTLNASSSELLLYESEQEIDSPIKIEKLSASVAHIFSNEILRVNDLEVDKFSDFLHLSQDQVIEGDLYFESMIINNADIYSFKDGEKMIYPKDFLLSSKDEQIVTGHHEYAILDVGGEILPPEGSSDIEINGIKTSEFILQNSDVVFKGSKIFSKELSIGHNLEIQHLNDVDYDSLWESAIKVSDNKILLDSVDVGGSLTVDGRVKVEALNGINLKDLEKNAIKYSLPDQFINSPVVLKDSLNVLESMKVEKINDIEWRKLLRTEESLVKANIPIKKAYVLGNLNSNLINGLDLDKEAVLTNVDQEIEGHVIFTDSVTVSGPQGVTLAKGVTINGVDISKEKLPTANQSIIDHSVELEELRIKCDIYTKTIGGYRTNDLEDKYWRKSTEQTIEEPFSVVEAIFEKPVFASSLNNIKPSDYLLSDADQNLKGMNYFNERVFLESLDVAEGATIDGVNLKQLKDNAVSLHGRQFIGGHLNFNSIKVENLSVASDIINKINVREDLLHSKNTQHTGNIIFRNSVTSESAVFLGSLNADKINGAPSSEYFPDTKKSIKQINGDLIVDSIEAEDVTATGLVNGKNLTDIFKRALKKNKPDVQHLTKVVIEGPADFIGPQLHLTTVNGKDWTDYLNNVIQVGRRENIEGPITFLAPVVVSGNLTASRINGIDLKGLSSSLLSKSEDQIISGKYTFKNGIVGVDLNVPKISGVPLDEILLTDKPAVLRGTTRFAKEAVFSSIRSPHFWLSGCNLEAVLRSGEEFDHQYLLSPDVTLGHLRVKGNLTTSGRLLSQKQEIDILELLSKFVSKTSNQFIKGPVKIENAFLKDLETDQINNIALTEIIRRLEDSSKKVHECDLRINSTLEANSITAKHFTTTDLEINGIRLQEVKSKGVHKGHKGRILGKKEFLSDVIVKGDLQVLVLNGIETKDMIPLNSQYFGRDLKFSEIAVDGNIITKTIRNGSQPENILYKLKENYFGGSSNEKRNISLHVKGDILVDEINGLKMSDLVLSEKDFQLISGRKHFPGLRINGTSYIDVFNGIPLDQLLIGDFDHWPLAAPSKIRERVARPVETASLLRATAVKTKKLNDISFDYTKNLYQELFSLSEVNVISIPGAINLHLMKLPSGISISVLVDRKDSCPYTHRIKNEGGKFYEEARPLEGVYIPFSVSYGEKVFDFFQRCRIDHYDLTMARQLSIKNQRDAVLTKAFLDLGLILEAKTFSTSSKNYFVFASKQASNSTGNSLDVISHGRQFRLVWREDFDNLIKSFDLIEENNTWHMALTMDVFANEGTHEISSRSLVYSWNNDKEEFIHQATFSDGTITTSIMFAKAEDDLFLLIGQISEKAESCVDIERQRNVKVLRKGKSNYEPLTSLSVQEVSSLVKFNVDNQLYIGVSSRDSLRIFKRIKNEDFKQIKKFPIEEAASMIYFTHSDQHFIALLSLRKRLTILQLIFGGISNLSLSHVP